MNNLVALCAVGAEKIVGNEIKSLGCTLDPARPNLPGRVFFVGDDDAPFRANLCLRTADRVYLLMARFRAEDFDDLFDGVRRIDLQDVFKKNTKVVVDKVRSRASRLSSEHAVQGVVQKAIYQKLGESWRMLTLPESGERADVRVYIDGDEAQICLDLSGLPLHKRGYRTDGGTAPLRETTAAVMLQMMTWRRKMPLHDPFCGSGTLPIEACLYAHNVAPGFGRRFALENLAFFDAARAADIRRAEAENIRADAECRITGTDADPAAIERARANADHACVMAGRALRDIGSAAHIPRPSFDVADFSDIEAPFGQGVIVCNPPYGERLGEGEDALNLYRRMSSLFSDFAGWRIGVITANKRFQECLGRYASTLKNLRAGNLDTTVYIYDGTEKEKRAKARVARKAGGAQERRTRGRH